MNKILSVVLVMSLGLAACGSLGQQNDQSEQSATDQENAEKVSGKTGAKSLLIPLKNQKGKAIGEARFVQTPKGVKITIEASKLEPGLHGIHIHETGKCVPPDFKSAGEHFNPFHMEHGLKNPKGAHAGDLPNIMVEENGTVQTSILAKKVTLEKGKKNSLLDEDGSALVIHAKPDDNKSQPSGAAGERVACGEITE
ncbi:MAG TPA: superoxide dismutase family protein [Bacillales bacterium]|nr:superoxide dismutase family protein [Bacillales bacterium]